jgi:catechol 2,3-dioxygenase-like lactoylglutathione lyase family enzyme
MMKKRTGEPWMPAGEYGRSLPVFTVNLLVTDVERSVAFYREVLGAEERYSDPDFAALRLGGLDFMLHADHTYDSHPWYGRLLAERQRGLGAELRLFGVNPDEIESCARAAGAVVLQAATDHSHGWREVWVQDPDGYVWAVGSAIGG